MAKLRLLVAFCIPLLTEAAHAAGSDWSGDRKVAVRLITGSDRIGARRAIDAGIEFRFASGWHGYWRTPGDSGFPLTIDWTGSENIEAGAISWPAPERLAVNGYQNAVYTGGVILPLTLAVRDSSAPARIRATLSYAACADICVPYESTLSLDLPVGLERPSAQADAIATSRRRVPASPNLAGFVIVDTSVSDGERGRRLVADIDSPLAPFSRPDLFVEGNGSGLPGAPSVLLSDDRRSARMELVLGPKAPDERPLRLTLVDGDRATEFAISD